MGVKPKILRSLIATGLIFCLYFSAFGQEFRTHKVKPGESIEDISSKYMVTPFDIYALNPDAKQDLRPNMVIVIPKSRIAKEPSTVEKQQVSGFKTHKVKKKETLYSIAKKYAVSVEDIKRHNKRLYSENLRRGDRIQIPEFQTVKVTNLLENTLRTYKVQPKEGKWRIAYKYGITVEELEQLNPRMGDTLKVDQEINVPNIADNEIRAIDEEYGYYTVLPKEGFYRLKLKMGLSQEELEALNPELKDGGLKAGMILKVPRSAGSSDLETVNYTDLSISLTNFNKKKIALMLPFRLNRIDLDSIQETREQLKQDRFISISLDFHSGVLMALDSAKRLGISTKLDVFDTQSRVSRVSDLISRNDFSDYDAVIGPLTAANFDRAANMVKPYKVPILAPFVKPDNLQSHVYQTIPPDDYLRSELINYVKKDTLEANIIIIADSKNRTVSDQIRREFPSAKQVFSRKNKEGKDANYILVEDIEQDLPEGRTIVFLETSDEGFVSNVTSMLSAFNGKDMIPDPAMGRNSEKEIEREIILMTTNKNSAFEGSNVSNYDLSSLQFHFPSVNRSCDLEVDESFMNAYRTRYGALPNKYAVRGFDLTLDLLLRLASTDEKLFDASESDLETRYIENKFRYAKKMFGGYYNQSAYIMKYADLKIIAVKQ